jgi:uncharacterized membrane protein HdeD (DUF308 family)
LQIMESPPWLRMLRIVIGGISIILSLVVLVSLSSSILTALSVLSVVLLVLGIERISAGVALPNSKRSRLVDIVLGLAIISFSIVLMEFPIFASSILVVIGAVALLLSGIARIVHGASKDSGSGLHRAFLIGVGALSIAVSILVIARPIEFGLAFFVILISIAFFASGVEMMVLGITKR